MPATNILILIHGITVDSQPLTHQTDYDGLWEGLKAAEPALDGAFAKRVCVEWGHRPPNVETAALRPDQRIMDAENALHDLAGIAAVAHDASPQNHLLSPLLDIPAQILEVVTNPIKEKVVMLGFTDVLYYIAGEGEDRVRATIYHQVLTALDGHKSDPSVRLHLIGHSLGVTVGHDFLFGLFAPDDQLTGGRPGFLNNDRADPEDKAAYDFWRARARVEKSLTLGSKTSAAGQLPLMMMRKQALVDSLVAGQRLDPAVIGIAPDGGVQWRMFYDVLDVLAYPARRLYSPMPAIEEFQVDNGPNPVDVHSGYWTNETVLLQTADLLKRNLG